jgi:menaquinol-cytochrome c reductase iron-sulfur subunit
MLNRRRFIHWCSLSLSALAALFVAIPGVGFLIDPLLSDHKRKKRHRLLKLSDLKIGVPRRMAIIDQRVDAWTRYPEGPIGSVWLRRRDEKSVDAFSATCPHLGCPVNFVAADEQFHCPCHEASFAADGSIIAGPQQRGLDHLDVAIETVGKVEWVSVVFERFEPGISKQKSLG